MTDFPSSKRLDSLVISMCVYELALICYLISIPHAEFSPRSHEYRIAMKINNSNSSRKKKSTVDSIEFVKQQREMKRQFCVWVCNGKTMDFHSFSGFIVRCLNWIITDENMLCYGLTKTAQSLEHFFFLRIDNIVQKQQQKMYILLKLDMY